MRSCEGAERAERRHCEYELLSSSAWITDCVTTFPLSPRKKKTGLGNREGGLDSALPARPRQWPFPAPSAAFYQYVKVKESNGLNQTKGRVAGKGRAVAWLVHSSPLHRTPCTSTATVSGRAQSNNKISLLHSLLALPKGSIQRIAASLYLHTNKREDVDSYRCLPPPLRPCMSLVICQFFPLHPKSCGDVRLEKPLGLLMAIRALEPPLTLIRQHKEDMNKKYDWGLQTSASIAALEHIGVWWQQQGDNSLLNKRLCMPHWLVDFLRWET